MSVPRLLDFEGTFPKIRRGVFVAPGSTIIGDVVVGPDSSIWYHAVVRGDVCPITIGERTNIQDMSVIHVTTDTYSTHIGDDVTVGHRALLHGCRIGNRCLIGMGAIVMDGAVLEDECLIAAGTLVPPGMHVPSGVLVMGSPGSIKRDLTDEERQNIRDSAHHYVRLGRRHADETGDGGSWDVPAWGPTG